MAMEVLAYQLQGLRRCYEEGPTRRAALDDLSLAIPQRSFMAVVGPSGSGKSTLLSVMGALDRGYEGKIEILGRDLRGMNERELGRLRNDFIGFVFQSFHLLPHLSVLENVASPALFAPSCRGAEEAARKALDRVGLLDRANDRPQHLSGGQRQRVALARALVRSPPILLCDEPTGNLDSRTGHEVIDLLERLHAEESRTIIVVTHEERLAQRARRRVELVDGKVVNDTGEVP
ncbi:MAG: ABC transporter ATP-binding protein [Myxococcales bacterium]|nr:ABC transporter ATP-binding protein [Polyangiaceae bacterium]MDW8248982.1 ABC transporter ATP-binding protein [Myxococcales bacterium]